MFIAGGICNSNRTMPGKTVIITGANSGIGKATAIDLAKRGARVIMACRDLERSETAVKDIIWKSGSSNIILKRLNLSSLRSIRAFADEDIKMNEAELHVLINIISSPQRQETEDGFEMTMGVNHFGHFLLTNLLLDLLKKSAPARVVIVSSIGHHLETRSPFRFDNMHSQMFYSHWDAYGQSKLANILFTRELARLLVGSGVTANSLHPGITRTQLFDFNRHLGFPIGLEIF